MLEDIVPEGGRHYPFTGGDGYLEHAIWRVSPTHVAVVWYYEGDSTIAFAPRYSAQLIPFSGELPSSLDESVFYAVRNVPPMPTIFTGVTLAEALLPALATHGVTLPPTEKHMNITPFEANFLLFCLDAFCKTDSRGKVTVNCYGYGLTPDSVQDLRDRLMAIHDHPEE